MMMRRSKRRSKRIPLGSGGGELSPADDDVGYFHFEICLKVDLGQSPHPPRSAVVDFAQLG